MSDFLASLTHRVTIEEPSQTSDGAGGYTTSWSEVDTVWAALRPYSTHTHEQFADEKLAEQHRITMTIRYRTDVDHTMRASIGGEYYNIRTAVDPDMRKVKLECVLEKGVAI